jgi:peroxiredoxin
MLTTRHTVNLSGLTPRTTYFVSVKSQDIHGNETTLYFDSFTTDSDLPTGPEVGMHGPDFTLETLDGSTMTLSDYAGQIVVLHFFSAHCRPCIIEMPLVQEIYTKWSERGLVLLAITSETDQAELKEFVAEHGLTFPILIDGLETVNEAYLVPFTPYTLFLDEHGVLREIKEGRFTELVEMEEILDLLFKSKDTQ